MHRKIGLEWVVVSCTICCVLSGWLMSNRTGVDYQQSAVASGHAEYALDNDSGDVGWRWKDVVGSAERLGELVEVARTKRDGMPDRVFVSHVSGHFMYLVPPVEDVGGAEVQYFASPMLRAIFDNLEDSVGEQRAPQKTVKLIDGTTMLICRRCGGLSEKGE